MYTHESNKWHAINIHEQLTESVAIAVALNNPADYRTRVLHRRVSFGGSPQGATEMAGLNNNGRLTDRSLYQCFSIGVPRNLRVPSASGIQGFAGPPVLSKKCFVGSVSNQNCCKGFRFTEKVKNTAIYGYLRRE